MGYDKDLFVSRDLAAKFLCAVCQGVAKDTFETDCGHIFCRSCVERLIRKTSTSSSSAQCPHCRSQMTWSNVHASKFLSREITNLQCRCNLCREWIGQLSQLGAHQDEECPDGVIECEWKKFGCKEFQVKRKDLATHNEQYKMQHLECKIAHLRSQHAFVIDQMKRRYEQQIQQLTQKSVDMELKCQKWKHKCFEIAKKYGTSVGNSSGSGSGSGNGSGSSNGSQMHIGHQHSMVVSSSTSTTQLQSQSYIATTPMAAAAAARNEALISCNSDGSMSYDPDASQSSRGKRKRNRTVLQQPEFDGEDVEEGEGEGADESEHESDMASSNVSSKRVRKRRRIDSQSSNNGSSLSLLCDVSVSNTGVVSVSHSTRKKKTKNASSKKKKKTRRNVQVVERDDSDERSSVRSDSEFEPN